MIDFLKLARSAILQVRADFNDFYNNPFREGELLTFVEHKFLPYHGGHTIVFKEKTLYLQDEQNANILGSLGSYFKLVANPGTEHGES